MRNIEISMGTVQSRRMSSPNNFETRLQKAQSRCYNSLSASLLQLVNAHADAIGVPLDFIIWPLLTATASFMGTNAFVQINNEWLEPAIIWFVIAARKGEKKTAAHRRIRR